MSYLIADSGATKTDWLYVDGTDTTHIKTQGLHPSNIQQMSDSIDIQNQTGGLKPDLIYFFGAGCGNPVSDEIVQRFLQPIFPESVIRISSDLDGSGKAFFGTGNGIVAVLGTGSVSARIEKGMVASKSAALGFAIGDEGSAADLGRRILKHFFRKTADKITLNFIAEKLDQADYATMMNRIYRAGKPNRELASVAGEVLIKPLPLALLEMIQKAFGDFADQQLSMLNISKNEPIVFTGKVAEVHKEILIPVMKQKGYDNVSIRYPVIAAFRDRIKKGECMFG
jgi:glucosamine kinase